MLKKFLGGLAGCLLAVQVFGSPAAAQSPDRSSDIGYELWKQQLVRGSLQQEEMSPEAVVDVSGTFRVRGIVQRKTPDISYCSCGVEFVHTAAPGRTYSQQGQMKLSGTECTMDVPFHFERATSDKPVQGYIYTYCESTDGQYRRSSQDIRPFPIKNGPSRIIKFNIDM